MGDINLKYASASAMTITVASLANGSLRQATGIDNGGTVFIDSRIAGQITTGTSPTVDTAIKFYAAGSVDGGTRYSGNASGTDSAYTGPIDNSFLIGQVKVTATSDFSYEFGPFSVAAAFDGILPEDWTIIIENDTGASLNSTGGNHVINFQGVEGQVA